MRFSALIAAAALGAAALGARAAPLSAYGALPNVEDESISPDGRLLAIDFVNGETRKVVVQDIDGGRTILGVDVGAHKLRGLYWAGDDHLIIVSSITEGVFMSLTPWGEFYHAADLNLPKKKLAPLLQDLGIYSTNQIFSDPIVRKVDGQPALLLIGAHFQGVDAFQTLYRIDLDRDNSIIAGETPGALLSGILVGPDARPLAISQYNAPTRHWSLKILQNGGWREVETKTAGVDRPWLRGLSADGGSILVSSLENEVYVTRLLSLASGKLSDPLPISETAGVLDDPWSGRMIGTTDLEGDRRAYDFVDPDDQVRWRAVEAAFKGALVSLVSVSDDHRRLIVSVDSGTDVPEYALVDLRKRSVSPLGRQYLALSAADVSPKSSIAFAAADGLKLTGYLTLPTGRAPKDLPLIVFPHGGPAARDDPGFDWWAQAMASRGYAVLQVNYRGSSGFGRAFLAAGFGEWGRKMQTDLSDGVKFLASQGTIDPARVCVVGASYGGYAALAGMTLQTGVYRCAVSIAGPSDLPLMIGRASNNMGQQGQEVERYWDRYMGAKSPADPSLRDISPADHADRVAGPILLIHGQADTVVPFEQSQRMLDSLKKAGKTANLVVLKNEDHWLSTSDTRQQMLEATMAFLQQYDPPS